MDWHAFVRKERAMKEFMSIREYAQHHGLQLSEAELAQCDRELEAHCRANGIPIRKEYRLSEAQLADRLLLHEQVGYARALEDLAAFVRDLVTALEEGRVIGSPVEVARGMLLWSEGQQHVIFPEADALAAED
jgi:hypothetical protein